MLENIDDLLKLIEQAANADSEDEPFCSLCCSVVAGGNGIEVK